MPIIKICEVCNIEYPCRPYRKNHRTFCSRKCWSKKRSEEMRNICPPQLEKFKVKTGDIGHNKGFNHSKEAKNKMSISHTGKRTGNLNPAWKGGAGVTTGGYRIKRINGQNIKEHRYVMEQHIGRPLEKWEIVHHINGIKDDNRIENLMLTTRSFHFGNILCPYCSKTFSIR